MAEDWKQCVIYIHPPGGESDVFISPDGVGRYFYDTIEDAEEDTGFTKHVWLDQTYEW